MQKLQFLVRSSSSNEVYSLSAYKTVHGVRFSCSCPAGENGLHCKHRIALASGDGSQLAEPDAAGVCALLDMLAPTEVPMTLARIDELERMAATIKKELADARRRLGILFHG